VDKDYLGRLNSATKYPSIDTYHKIDPRTGRLLPELSGPIQQCPVIMTEKVNGTNGRIILQPDGDWFIGSREEILYAKGDRIENPQLSIVPALLPLAERIGGLPRSPKEAGSTWVFFLEVYGHRIGPAAKQYTTSGLVHYRMFDVAEVDREVLTWEREQISGWREHGGQSFANEDGLQAMAAMADIPLVPRLGEVAGDQLPVKLEDMQQFLADHLKYTGVALDEGAAYGKPEGLVLRTRNRSPIYKARFEDYQRTLAPPQKNRRKPPPGATNIWDPAESVEP